MTPQERKVFELALEAMTYADACLKKQLTTKDKHEYAQDLLLEAGTAIKEALAHPDQEPVAWITPDGEGFRIRFSPPVNDVPLGWDALYTTPPQRAWVRLTDDEIEKGRDQIFSINNPYCPCDSETMRKAVRWAEAKLKDKNTRGQE